MKRRTGGEGQEECGKVEEEERRTKKRGRGQGKIEKKSPGRKRRTVGGGRGGAEGGRGVEVHLGQREVVGQGHAFLAKQLLLLLCQLEVWVELQQKKKSANPLLTNQGQVSGGHASVSPCHCGGWEGPAWAAR